MKRKVVDNLLFQRYHYKHRQTALAALKGVEAAEGPTAKHLLKRADEYAADVLGWKGYAPWLYVYSAMCKEFKEGWIPDNYYGQYVVPWLKGHYGKIADCKALTYRLFASDLFPDAYYHANSLWFSSDYTLTSPEEIEEKIYRGDQRFVFKGDFSERGKSIVILDNKNKNFHKITTNGVIQHYIEKHPFFDAIVADSVPTFRLTTAVDAQGQVSLRGSVLRVGRKGDSHLKASSNLRIGVDLQTGALREHCYTPDWHKLDRHPDTGFVFKGQIIPEFQKCVQAVLELHKKVPFTRIIGWDVIVDRHGDVKVMEWNGQHNDIKFSEATQGPILTGLGLETLWKTHPA